MVDYANLRRLRFVPRWAVVPTVTQQNVAEHSFHVLWIYAWLYERYQFHTPSFADALRVLAHDSDEAVEGDAPGPTKGPPDTEGASADKAWMKIADYLEAGIFLSEEDRLGNSTLEGIADDLRERGNRWVEVLRGFGWKIESFEEIAQALWDEVNIEDHPGLRAARGRWA